LGEKRRERFGEEHSLGHWVEKGEDAGEDAGEEATEMSAEESMAGHRAGRETDYGIYALCDMGINCLLPEVAARSNCDAIVGEARPRMEAGEDGWELA